MRHGVPIHSEEGFTLIELLVALALTAVIATSILAGFGLAQRAWLSSVAGEPTGEVLAATSRLRDLLSKSVATHAISETDGLARLAFDGGQQNLTFVTLSEAESFPGGLMRVHLSWRQSAEAGGAPPVILNISVFRSRPSQVTETKPVTLFRSVGRFTLKYFGPTNIGQAPEWQSEWRGRTQLPSLVQVEADIKERGQSRRLVLPISLRHASAL